MKGGQIIQVQGGHIIRSTGRKDRHSKVYTSKGPRDRRVRLSAHTAIQFYDVQDRLGYDRPSKALDWLIQKATNAINELPVYDPAANGTAPSPDSNPSSNEAGLDQQTESHQFIQLDSVVNGNINPVGSSFMQPFLQSNSMNFPDLCNGVNQVQDLGLSLHSLHAENHGNLNNVVGFQENMPRIDNWDHGSSNMEETSRNLGFVLNSQQELFSQGFQFSQRDLLQSNLPVHATDQHFPASRSRQSSDFRGHFSLEFHVPAQFYSGNDEEKNR